MALARLKLVSVPKHMRIICISDVHGKIDLFRKLLDKAGFSDEDILMLVGDICVARHDKSQCHQALEFVMALCERPNVYMVRGNWEIPKCLPDDLDEPLRTRAVEWFDCLPHIIETQEYIFVHAGLTSGNLREQEAKSCMLQVSGNVVFEKYVIVGHIPALNYSRNILSCNPFFDMERRIITIDGGMDTWGCGQLNALIIQNGSFSWLSADNLPVIRAENAQIAKGGDFSIVWVRDGEIEVVEKGEEFSICRHVKTVRLFCIECVC
jgi:protein phosphatase